METTNAEVIDVSLESTIQRELVKANVTDTVLNALKDKYGNLKLKSVDDKEGYLEIKEAKKDCSKLRNLTVKVCKKGREDALAIQKKWVNKEKEVVAIIDGVESPLDAEIEIYDNEVERKKNEVKQRQEEAYMHRTQALTKMGAVYENGSFSLGEFSMEATLVKETSQDIWENDMLPAFTAEYEKIEVKRIEADRLKAEKEAEIQRQQKELEAQQAAFKEQQAAFQKQQEDAARMEREKTENENREKERAKNELQSKRLQKISPFNPYNKGIAVSNLWEYSEEDFAALVEQTKQQYNNEQEQKQREIAEKAAKEERERIAEEQRLAEIKRQQEEQRKAEELAKSGDKAQWDNFIEQLSKVHVPVARSGQYRRIVATANDKIKEVLNLKP